MADAAADVRLNYSVHFRVSDQRDRLVDVFPESIQRELRCPHKVGPDPAGTPPGNFFGTFGTCRLTGECSSVSRASYNL